MTTLAARRNTDELVPQRDPSGLLVYQPDRGGVESFGSARLPSYARVDTRLTYAPDWGGDRVWFYLDTINVFNRTSGTVGLPTAITLHEEATATPYDLEVPLGASGVRLDVHPWAGRLRLSGGVAFPRGPYALRAKEAATYDVGGVQYEAGEITSLGGTASFRGAAPYLGIGWGSPAFGKKRFGLSLDVGVTFQGEPEVTLSATGPATLDPAFREDLARETEDVAEAVRGWRTYPVISLSLAYRLR